MKKRYEESLINEALSSISELTNAKIIVGDPLATSHGTIIVPVSKITVALLSGRGEYGKINLFQSSKNYPNSKAGGGIVTVKPMGFLIERGSSVKYLPCPQDVFDKAINSFDGIIETVLKGEE